MVSELLYGTFPMPGYQRRLITTKPEGVGWSNTGRRRPYFLVLHRILGSLWGTDAYFRLPNVPALTDYGLAVAAKDGAAQAGTILQWCDPTGYVTPWASGPVKDPYGDGLAWLRYFGYYDSANKNGISIEISGDQQTPIDEFSYGELVKLCAYWLDQMRYPYHSITRSPVSGHSGLVWHEEFTYGTGKRCPFDVVKELTPQLIVDIGTALRPYQTEGGTPIAPAEEEDVLADFPKSDAVLPSEAVWPNYGSGKVSRAWAEYGARTGIFNAPGQPWADPDDTGTRTLYCFEGGPCFDEQGALVVKVK